MDILGVNSEVISNKIHRKISETMSGTICGRFFKELRRRFLKIVLQKNIEIFYGAISGMRSFEAFVKESLEKFLMGSMESFWKRSREDFLVETSEE